ncbi:MAG: hypothetical protein KDJ97_02295 [Anaerolineae bacterium]|nr:hypothetical protein [Anaerolineae bacterium]
MQKQNIFINDRWLALMHGLFINPMTNRGKELTLSLESFDPELVKYNQPNLVGRWQVGPDGKLTQSYN